MCADLLLRYFLFWSARRVATTLLALLMNVHTDLHPTIRPPGHPATRPSGHTATRPSGHPATRPPGHPATRPPGHSATRPPGYPATRPAGQPASRPPGHPATQPPGHPATRPSGHGHPATRLPGHPATATRPPGHHGHSHGHGHGHPATATATATRPRPRPRTKKSNPPTSLVPGDWWRHGLPWSAYARTPSQWVCVGNGRLGYHPRTLHFCTESASSFLESPSHGGVFSYSILVNSYGFSISTCSHKPRHDQVRQKARSGWECYSHRTTCFDPFVGLETPRSSPRFPYFTASCLACFVCWLHSETETYPMGN